MKVFDAAELCDTLTSIRTAIIHAIRTERKDINPDDPDSPYPLVRRLHRITGSNLSLRQAIRLKTDWHNICRRGEVPPLVACEVFCNSHKDILK